MLYLARNFSRHQLRKSREIAENQNIPVKYLEQIMNSLKKCNLVESIRGAEGGYRLPRPPEEITIYEILKCLEGDLSILENSNELLQSPAGNFWKEIDRKIQEMLSINLKEFLDRMENREESFMYYI